ncbi:unnamed protein product [Rodentolepis nana]|uniref:glutathione gamma-glutamylcysteinyltransferase n=1 Tax=Rodentolepis nana TaxID=102285 RepID=A0A0R3TBP2_RODNA|nr:unnamed protein product [Rodentolepis nana]
MKTTQLPLPYVTVMSVDLHQPNCPTETIDIFRSRILSLCSQSLSTSGTILVVAYDRKAVNQTGSGHYTLVGGYHPKRDLILVLDTAAFKYPMHWAPLTSIYNGICSLDKITGRPRGYMLITRTFDPRIGLTQASSPTQDSQETGEAFEEYRTARETFISSSAFANVNRLMLFCFADAAFQAFFSPPSFLDPDSAGGRLRKVAEEWSTYLRTTPQNSLGKTCCCLLQPIRGSEHGKNNRSGPAHCSPILSPNSPPQNGRGQRCDCPCLVDSLLDKLLSLLITHRPPGFFFGCQPLWPDSSGSAASTIETATQIIFELVSSATGRRARLALERLPQRSYEWLTTDVCGPLAYRPTSSLNLSYGRPSFGVNSSAGTPSPTRLACAIPLVTDPKIRATTLLTAFLLAFPYHTIPKPKVTSEKVRIDATNTSTLIERLESSENLLNDLPNLSDQTCFTVLTPGTRSELTALSNILSQLVAIRRPLGTRCMEGKKDTR